MPLILATMEHDPIPAFLTSVGSNSELYTYVPVKAAVTPALPIIAITVVPVDCPEMDQHLLRKNSLPFWGDKQVALIG